MLVGLISDTHENMPMIKKAVSLFNEKEVDLVCHAGDMVSPLTAREFAGLHASFVAVFGNNDGDRIYLKKNFADIGSFHNEPYEFEIEGKRILLMHQPLFLDALAAHGDFDFIVYGHTHKVEVKDEGKPIIVNPGEAGGWLTGKCTVAILDTEKEKVQVIDLDDVSL